MPGIEAHWRHTCGTLEEKEPVNPVGDFDIDALQERTLINEELRRIVSRITNVNNIYSRIRASQPLGETIFLTTIKTSLSTRESGTSTF